VNRERRNVASQPKRLEEEGMFRRRKVAVLVTAIIAAAIVAPGGAMAASRPFKTRSVAFEGHRLHVRDYAGNGPPIVLMHGFPDDLHLYDRVFPLLHGRRVIAFDFLGWATPTSRVATSTPSPSKSGSSIRSSSDLRSGRSLRSCTTCRDRPASTGRSIIPPAWRGWCC
jgi:hypothetical protein